MYDISTRCRGVASFFFFFFFLIDGNCGKRAVRERKTQRWERVSRPRNLGAQTWGGLLGGCLGASCGASASSSLYLPPATRGKLLCLISSDMRRIALRAAETP